MPKITKVQPLPAKPPQFPEAKVLVYIDGNKCTPVRERTWRAMGLDVGSEISCDELRERESFHWKRQYRDSGGWEQEKGRLQKVKTFIENLDKRVVANIVGFGADSTEFIAQHPDEPGRPDLEVCLKRDGHVVLLVEVSGTKKMRGAAYWVRPDKLAYADNHAGDDVWVILHYAEPSEKFVIVRPLKGSSRHVMEKPIGGSIERYVEFYEGDPALVPAESFQAHLGTRVDRISASEPLDTY